MRAAGLAPADPRPLNNLALIALHKNDRAAALEQLQGLDDHPPVQTKVCRQLDGSGHGVRPHTIAKLLTQVGSQLLGGRLDREPCHGS